MQIIEKVVSYIKNNRIYIEDILNLHLNEDEFEFILQELKRLNIDVIIKEELLEQNSDMKGYSIIIKNYKKLSKEEEIDLFNRYKKGDKTVKEIIINQNLKLVIKVAKTYAFFAKQANIDFDDLVQQGIIGILEAMKKFDVSKGFRFTTYSYFWIKKNILDFLYINSRAFKLQASDFYDIYRIEKYVQQYLTDNQKEPNNLQISKQLSISIDRIEVINSIRKGSIYLDDTITNKQGENFLLYSVVRTDIYDKENEYDKINSKIYFEQFLKAIEGMLTPKEYDVITLRFGLNNNSNPQTLQQIANKYNVSREYIRIVENIALNKIKKNLEFNKNFNEEINIYKKTKHY